MAYTLDDLISELDACRDESALSPDGKKALEALKAQLDAADEGGPASPFDFDEFIARMKRERQPAAE